MKHAYSGCIILQGLLSTWKRGGKKQKTLFSYGYWILFIFGFIWRKKTKVFAGNNCELSWNVIFCGLPLHSMQCSMSDDVVDCFRSLYLSTVNMDYKCTSWRALWVSWKVMWLYTDGTDHVIRYSSFGGLEFWDPWVHDMEGACRVDFTCIIAESAFIQLFKVSSCELFSHSSNTNDNYISNMSVIATGDIRVCLMWRRELGKSFADS